MPIFFCGVVDYNQSSSYAFDCSFLSAKSKFNALYVSSIEQCSQQYDNIQNEFHLHITESYLNENESCPFNASLMHSL